MSIIERIENIEAILTHKFGTVDIEIIKKEDQEFFTEANYRLEKIIKSLDENDKLIQKLGNKEVETK